MSVIVEIVGLEEVQAKLQHVPNALKPLFKAAAEHGQQRMKIHAKPHPADKGTLAGAASYKLAAGGQPLSAKVGFLDSGLANIAATVNYGRAPGKPPGHKRLKAWLSSHGYLPGGLTPGQEYVFVRAVQKQIEAKGTKGVEFMEKTESDLQKELPSIIAKAASEVEKAWAA